MTTVTLRRGASTTDVHRHFQAMQRDGLSPVNGCPVFLLLRCDPPTLSWCFNFFNLFLFEKNRLTSLLLWGRGSPRSSWCTGPLPLHRHRLLAVQDGAGSPGVGQAPICAVLVLLDHVPDAAECGPGVLVDGGPYIGGRLSRAGSPLHRYHDPFAICRRLHTHSLAVNGPVVAEGVAGL